MKKIFALTAILVLVLAGCGNMGTSDDGNGNNSNNSNNNNNGNNSTTKTTLTINNMSSYNLLSVEYSSVEFGTVNSGKDVTKTVSTGTRYVFFSLQIAGENVRCRTTQSKTCDEGMSNELTFNNNTPITTTLDDKAGTLKDIVDAKTADQNIPQIVVKQDVTIISQNAEYDVGNVIKNATKDIFFTVENSGKADLTIESVKGNMVNMTENISGFFNIILQPVSQIIAPGKNANFTIQFSPTATGNNISATVQIKTNSQTNADFSFRVKGTCSEEQTGVPNGVTATAQSSSSIKISWNPVNGATSYKLYYGTSSSSITILASGTVAGTTYTHTGLQANTIYYYRVVASNSSGESGYSTSASARTLLSTPVGLTATGGQYETSISLSWSPVTGASGYDVYYGTSASSVTTLAGYSSGTTYTHSGLKGGTTYYYRVVAYSSAAGDSDYSSTVSATTKLSAPTITSVSKSYSSTIRIEWTSVTGATSYKVYYYTSDSIGNKTLAGSTVGTSYSHSTSLTVPYFFYYVVAVNSTGESDFSESYYFIVP